ncbi:hypothetical protein [Actinophytocola sp.]|uniref:hypothetical protein n=1 Tax=Actinophytocola sp. TaxID=1872138 RepID=UPI0025C56F8A|nr:hypothetical protein [Actinophytocola sp.]
MRRRATDPTRARVAGRQVALVADNRWKLERVSVYRDTGAARRAMADTRAALTDCASRTRDGVTTVWRFEPLDIGEEAVFVAGQRVQGDEGLPGHHRGGIARQGRTLVTYVDFGQARTLADRGEVTGYELAAATLAGRLRAAAWN